MSNNNRKVDFDFSNSSVPASSRRGTLTMFMIMLGFTFFCASMWVGQNLASGLDFKGFIGEDMRLTPVTCADDSDVEKTIKFYMGSNTPERKDYIMESLVCDDSAWE